MTKEEQEEIMELLRGRDASEVLNALMHTGNRKQGGVNYIPFQRQSQNRKDIKAIKTLSMPQMVSNQEVEKDIYEAINEKLGKRFDHYVDTYLKK